MRFKTSILLVVVVLLGGAGLFVARFALAQQPRGVPTVVQPRDGYKAEMRDAVSDPRPTAAENILPNVDFRSAKECPFAPAKGNYR